MCHDAFRIQRKHSADIVEMIVDDGGVVSVLLEGTSILVATHLSRPSFLRFYPSNGSTIQVSKERREG